MTLPRTSLIPALALAAALLGACGDDDTTESSSAATAGQAEETSTTETAAEDAVVTMEQSRFMPETLEVPAGTEVTFENTDPYAHTVTSAEGSAVEFDSGELGQDETFSQTFGEAGTYDYFCEIHPTMRAEVVVS